jgi:Xaa-Pro aminopeptidase
MSTQAFPMAAPAERYRQRRAQLAAQLQRPLLLGAGSAAAPASVSNPFPFRAESNYLYLGGPPIEGAAWLIQPGSDGDTGCTLARIPAGDDDALWLGEPPSDADLCAAAGIGAGQLCDVDDVAALCRGAEAVAVLPRCPATLAWAQTLAVDEAGPTEKLILIDLRMHKDEFELQAMRTAADATVAAHRAAMAATSPQRSEADVAAAFHGALIARQCKPSFQPIATIHGEVLHNHGHPNALVDGRLVLVDGGAEELGGYACDVTRTYPVSTWSDIQRHLHETVHGAMVEACAACVPGARYRDIHDGAGRTICAGLVEADLLRGSLDDLAERGAHTLFFPHGVGHLIGLDVHDLEDFGDLAGYALGRERRTKFGDCYLRLDRDLEPGMAVTIEPGIYFVPAIWRDERLTGPFVDCVNRSAVDALLADDFGGIRLEETLCVTGEQPEILTAALPSSSQAVTPCVGRAPD